MLNLTLFSIALFISLCLVVLIIIITAPKIQKDPIKSQKQPCRKPYEIEKIYGPLSVNDEAELAWPYRQSISIKQPDDKYGRWAKVDDITDHDIHFIGTVEDCWLQLEGPNAEGIKPHHFGVIRCRGKYYIFELNDKKIGNLQDYEWWKYPYEEISETRKFNIGNMSLYAYRNERPITIEGKNTNGVAVLDIESTQADFRGLIGSAEECWITLPDPSLAPYIAEKGYLGHHQVLYPYPYIDGADYITRAEGEFSIGGYQVTL